MMLARLPLPRREGETEVARDGAGVVRARLPASEKMWRGRESDKAAVGVVAADVDQGTFWPAAPEPLRERASPQR